MKLNDCIEAMVNLELDAMVWEIDNCPVKEFNDIYVQNGDETHVVLAPPHREDIAYRLLFGGIDLVTSAAPLITGIRLNEDYYFYVVTTDDKEYLKMLRTEKKQKSGS